MTFALLRDGPERQAVGLAAWRDQDPAVFRGGTAGSGLLLRLLQRGDAIGMPRGIRQ